MARRSRFAYCLSMRSQWSFHFSNASSLSLSRLSQANALVGSSCGSYSRSSWRMSSPMGLSVIAAPLLQPLNFANHLPHPLPGDVQALADLLERKFVKGAQPPSVFVAGLEERVRTRVGEDLIVVMVHSRISPARGSGGGGMIMPVGCRLGFGAWRSLGRQAIAR